MAEINYGSDTYCLTDLQLVDTLVTDPLVIIGQRVVRRLTTPPGALGLINDDPDSGLDVRQWINAKQSPGFEATAAAQIESECAKDEQVGSATASVTFSGNSISIQVDIETSSGPFLLTMDVGNLTTEVFFDFDEGE